MKLPVHHVNIMKFQFLPVQQLLHTFVGIYSPHSSGGMSHQRGVHQNSQVSNKNCIIILTACPTFLEQCRFFTTLLETSETLGKFSQYRNFIVLTLLVNCFCRYNFIVGGDGNVYVGRDWGKNGRHTKGMNEHSVAFSLCGDYNKKLPNEKMIKATKQLIQCGLEKKVIAQDYQLHGHRDQVCTECPGDLFYTQVRSPIVFFVSFNKFNFCCRKSENGIAMLPGRWKPTLALILKTVFCCGLLIKKQKI